MKDMRRTDLALELREDIEDEDKIEGISMYTHINKDNDIKVTEIIIENEEGAKALGKPIGSYITIESEELRQPDENFHEPMMKVLNKHIKEIIKGANKIFIAGLGNREVTPDALGPYVVDNLYITSHLIREGLIDEKLDISAIAPGVMAQTGIETGDILKALIDKTKPDVIIVIDALAARNSNRLNKTIQISDTGIAPGSGVGNHRGAITEENMGVKVIAIGVPTVISVPTIVNDSLDTMVSVIMENGSNVMEKFSEEEKYQIACEIVEPCLVDMFVTPKNIDEAVKRISYTISEAINGL